MEVTHSDKEAFRAQARAWLSDNCPAEMRTVQNGDQDVCWGGRSPSFQSGAQRVWMERMADRGWTVPAWPVAYGGAGLADWQEQVIQEEMAALGARPPLEGFGISMIGPALLRFGNDAQRREHLPKIARGEIRWCQGYSEPNAGSDLASLAMRADVTPEGLVVNGQKIWTSHADKSDWIFFLARTDTDAAKHQGISFLLVDMRTPGITTRPITLISGKSAFCETFFDNVRVDSRNVVGELGRGWEIAKYLLSHEREMIARGGSSLFDIHAVTRAARALAAQHGGRLPAQLRRAEAATLAVNTYAFEATRQRYLDEKAQGTELGARASVLKYCGTELNKQRQDLVMSLAGVDALYAAGLPTADAPAAATDPLKLNTTATSWLRSKANSIEGGTSEIMLEIISKRILHLPAA